MEYTFELEPYTVPDVDAMTDFSAFTPLIQHINDSARTAELMKELNGNVELLELLLEQGVDPSYDNNYAIRFASSHGNLAVVDRLLKDPRVDPSAKINYANYAIRFASFNGHFLVVDRLIQSSVYDSYVAVPAVEKYKEILTILRSAIKNARKNGGHPDVVKRLLLKLKEFNKLMKSA